MENSSFFKTVLLVGLRNLKVSLICISGKKGFARSAVRYGASWVLTVDFLDGPQCDLLDNSVRKRIQFLLNSKVFIHLSAAPIQLTFAGAITPAVRTHDEPSGIRSVSPAMKVKIADGNAHSKWLAGIIRICVRLGIRYIGSRTPIPVSFGSYRNGEIFPMVHPVDFTNVITALSRLLGENALVFRRMGDRPGSEDCALVITSMFSVERTWAW